MKGTPEEVAAWRAKRDATIVARIAEGRESLSDVSKDYGISVERVRQIVKRERPGLDLSSRRATIRFDALVERERGRVERAHERQVQGREQNEVRTPSLPRYSEEEMLEQLRAYVAEHGIEPATSKWDRSPTVMTYVRKFGSWQEAKAQAGVLKGRRVSAGPPRQWSHEACARAVAEFLRSEPSSLYVS
jgi:hypothetical protein